MNKPEIIKRQQKLNKNFIWKSTNGKSVSITEIDTEYLLNILRKCFEKKLLAEAYPSISEFQHYEGFTYSQWCHALKVEYDYRELMMEEDYNAHLDYDTYVQSKHDRDYYDDRYDIGAYGDCF